MSAPPPVAGRVYLIGAGPGDPELLTRRAWRLLGESDTVLYDALVDPGVQAAAPHARWISTGKRCGRASMPQAMINRLIVAHALRGETVARLKGGDPSVFGRSTEEIEACHRHGITVAVVPGVTAASAAAADLGLSLTSRGLSRSVCFVTPRIGHGESGDHHWIEAARAADTAVLYMAYSRLREVASALIEAGLPAQRPLAIVESAGAVASAHAWGPLRWTGTLAQIAAGVALPELSGPVLVLLGEVTRPVARVDAAQAEANDRARHGKAAPRRA